MITQRDLYRLLYSWYWLSTAAATFVTLFHEPIVVLTRPPLHATPFAPFMSPMPQLSALPTTHNFGFSRERLNLRLRLSGTASA
jgi:hypothetical protein